MAWSLFTLNLRIKYYRLTPEEYKRSIVLLIKKMINEEEYESDKYIDTELMDLSYKRINKMFTDFIINYLLYMKKNTLQK